jgi:eukaryotic-like serine/threonine-protein kinase
MFAAVGSWRNPLLRVTCPRSDLACLGRIAYLLNVEKAPISDTYASGPPSNHTIGRYTFGEAFASGGMATVHRGHWTDASGTRRHVAIKRLHPHLARSAEFVDMFLDEARTSRRLNHPNIVPTLEVVVQNKEVFLVMEYIPGESLANVFRVLRANGRALPVDIACHVIGGVLLGLDCAHRAVAEDGRALEIVHRDVSPQNILVGVDGVPRLIDFGIARAVGRLHETRDGTVKGKTAYMAPEQFSGVDATTSSDIYAVSVVFWELLTGARLFDGPHDGIVMGRILAGDIQKPSLHNRACSPALDEVVMAGLARTPGDRWPTAKAMARALARAQPAASPVTVVDWLEAHLGEGGLPKLAEPLRSELSDRTELSSSPNIGDDVSVKKLPAELTFTGATLEVPTGPVESAKQPSAEPSVISKAAAPPPYADGRGGTLRIAREPTPELRAAQELSALWVGGRSSGGDFAVPADDPIPLEKGRTRPFVAAGLILAALAAAVVVVVHPSAPSEESGPPQEATAIRTAPIPAIPPIPPIPPIPAITPPSSAAEDVAAMTPPQGAPVTALSTISVPEPTGKSQPLGPGQKSTRTAGRAPGGESRPGPGIASPGSPPKATSTAPDCRSPYVQDEHGRKIFKRECL